MSILTEAEEIINGDREKTYDKPDANLRRIAALWTIILETKLLPNISLTSEDICLCMNGVKIARLIHTPNHHDSQVDLCGYTALMEKVQQKEPK